MGCGLDSTCFTGINTSLLERAERVFTANVMLVGAYSQHCDLRSLQENSQPERQPPTYSLTLTSPPHPHRIQSNRKLSPQNTFRNTKGIHEGHRTIAYNTATPGKYSLARVQWAKQNKQRNRNTHSHTQKKKCSKANHYFHILMFSNVLYFVLSTALPIEI